MTSAPPARVVQGAHHNMCFVCGPENRASVCLQFCPDDDGLVGRVTFGPQHQGVPGVAHGGAIAALMDEAAGSVLIQQGLQFVTAKLVTDFVAPVLIGEELSSPRGGANATGANTS